MKVTEILRHPLKSHGREALSSVTLQSGCSMPWDRVWAIAHDAAKAVPGEWAHCANFSRIAKAPTLMAMTSQLDETSEALRLTHPDLGTVTVHPERDAKALLAWLMPLMPRDRALPAKVMRLDGRGYTDSDFPSVTLCNTASHRAVEEQAGRALSIHRWRGNIWFDSAAPWIERDWMGRDIRIGDARLRVQENTDRCPVTHSNPETGERDFDILGTLDHWGHQDFSVRAEVITGGLVEIGSTVEMCE